MPPGWTRSNVSTFPVVAEYSAAQPARQALSSFRLIAPRSRFRVETAPTHSVDREVTDAASLAGLGHRHVGSRLRSIRVDIHEALAHHGLAVAAVATGRRDDLGRIPLAALGVALLALARSRWRCLGLRTNTPFLGAWKRVTMPPVRRARGTLSKSITIVA